MGPDQYISVVKHLHTGRIMWVFTDSKRLGLKDVPGYSNKFIIFDVNGQIHPGNRMLLNNTFKINDMQYRAIQSGLLKDPEKPEIIDTSYLDIVHKVLYCDPKDIAHDDVIHGRQEATYEEMLKGFLGAFTNHRYGDKFPASVEKHISQYSS